VFVIVDCVSSNDERASVQFMVRDTGIGIPQHKLEHIFKAFVQADASTTRRFGGTGLGLAICTRLVVAMGGKLQVSSRVGVGTEFFFTLNFVKTDRPNEEPTEAERLSTAANEGAEETDPDSPKPIKSTLQILLVEDSLMNQVLAIGILQREGHVVTVANNGVEAVEAFEASPFDLILMDVQMPEMDGLQATAAIRQIEATKGGHTPILAMTAHALTGDRERCLAAGMDGYLAKPVRLNDLLRAIPEVCASV
jgi:CheY-like chemotaxis protein